MQLQDNYPGLAARGIGLAAISYDPPETLKQFASAHGITFPLLSDAGSATITRYGLLNAGATGVHAGIPHPGTLMLDSGAVVVSRSFEARFTERATAASLAARRARPATDGGTAHETDHLTLRTSTSDRVVVPGTRLALIVDVAPKPAMHVYAPEQKDYIPVSLTLDPGEAFTAHAPVFPPAETFFFKPLKETQLVYTAPFRIVQDITVALTPAVRKRANTAHAALTITGTLRYQACDDAICYLPKNVPVEWTVGLRPFGR